MSAHADFLLVGGGLASATAAEALRLEGAAGTIVIVAAEHELPYHRPPLSKHFLLSNLPTERLLVHCAEYYGERDIEVLRGTKATAVDPQRQVVSTDRAGPIHYGKLLIATGARPTALRVPGATLRGIYSLRTVDDAQAIKNAARSGARVVIAGGSFVGVELAAALARMGLRVTLLAQQRVLFPKLEAPQVSEHLRRICVQHGIEIVFADSVAEFRGDEDVTAVVTQGGRVLPCDFAATGIGVTPNIDFLRASGIALQNGVLVDCYLQTNQPNVFAAGDVANFFHPVFNTHCRIEHWDNAVKQGRLAAKIMLGQRLRYDEVSYFFADVFDFSFQFFGMAEGAPERVEIGSLAEKRSALLYLRNDVPRALFTTGRPAKETKAIESLIRYRVKIAQLKRKLADPAFLLERIPSQTVLILQGGGALGAFECGVVRALEENAIYPDIVAGVSIGAFNGAIIASHPKHAAEALRSFWTDLTIDAIPVADEHLRRTLGAWQTLAFGVPAFFQPRWLMPLIGMQLLPYFWTSYYDPSRAKALLAKYVDFDGLKSSPVRLLTTAVNVETAALEVFDSYIDELTPDHILASGSLPPGLPWTTINGKHYWDGGIVSNSPLEVMIDRCGAAGKRIFVVDLFSGSRPLPTNIVEVMGRRDEIVYTERIRRDSSTQELVGDFRQLVQQILAEVDPVTAEQLRQHPRYVQLMGSITTMDVTRIVRPSPPDEPTSKDYDFSRTSIEMHVQTGYEITRRTLAERPSEIPRTPTAPTPKTARPSLDPSHAKASTVTRVP